MDATKTRRRKRNVVFDQSEQKAGQRPSAQSAIKIIELAFWGTVFWGTFRLAAHYLQFTPYGLGAFARPFLGVEEEDSYVGMVMGAMALFVLSAAAALLFSLLFRKIRIWWLSLLYGAVLLGIAGYFFRMENWKMDTLSTEGAWFLSYGLFIGMTLMLEQSDERQ